MTVVIDASVVVASLINDARYGQWATSVLDEEQLAAPHGLTVEVTHGLRRLAVRQLLTQDAATLALADAIAIPTEFHAFAPHADRVWELRDNLTPYDAWYVAVAEALDAPLVTLDGRLASAPGPHCTFLTPDST